MGYLHFDRVKIPQENSIFNGSSSIQLSSVNELLKEHGIVLKNNKENETKSSNQHYQNNNDGFLTQSSHNDVVPLGLDEELSWDFNHAGLFTNKPESNFTLKNSIFDNNNFSYQPNTDASVVMSVNNVATKINRKDLLDLKVHKALVDIPGFNEIKEKYQCSVHRNGRKGRGRKMKCCQTADDLFKLALKEKCKSIGIHDYSKLKRRRGRPKKSAQSSPSNVTSTISSSSTYLSKDFMSNQQNEEPAGSGQPLEDVDHDQNTVQFQLKQLQKQLNEQQLLLNEQMKSINLQRIKLQSTNTVPVMNSFDQPNSKISNFYQFLSTHLHKDSYGFKPTQDMTINPESNLLQKHSQLSDISNLVGQQPMVSSFENGLSPISMHTPHILSPERYSHRSSIANMNNILVNELLNSSVPKVVPPESHNSILNIDDQDEAMHEEEHHEESNDHTRIDLEETVVKASIHEEKPRKKYQKKIKSDVDKKLTHISGKKIEVDPITNKMKCFHEGCDAQFKKKAYLSRHMKKHLPIKDHICPFWSEHVNTVRHAYPAGFSGSSSQGVSSMNSIGESLPFEKKLREHGLLECISEKNMNKYISTMQCHQKGCFTRKDEFMIHLKSFHVITDLPGKPDYAVCVECGEEFTSLKDWYENHLNSLSCSKIINRNFNLGRALRKQYEKETRVNRPKTITQEKSN